MSKIYFFNGWGMDENLLKPVKNSTEYDIEVINFPYNIDKSSIDKDDIFIGYSFGVYYLNKFLSENKDLKYKKAIGINGLPETIGKFGINVDKIKNELQFFKDNYKIIDNHIDFYYIGKNDRIIPANRLEKYCQNYNLAYKLLECGHYPFSYFTNFKDILDI